MAAFFYTKQVRTSSSRWSKILTENLTHVIATIARIDGRSEVTSTFEQRVQAACDQLNIDNPVREEDVLASTLSFYVDGEWLKVEGTDLNKVGRLFFQLFIPYEGAGAHSTLTAISLHMAKIAGSAFFGERWEDAEEKGRKLLMSFKQAEIVAVHWK